MELLQDFQGRENLDVNGSTLAEFTLSFEEFGNTINESLEYSNATMQENGSRTFPPHFWPDGEYIFDRTDVRVIFFIIYTIVFCSCFFGNLMVILVVTLHWRMRSITNFCLANLAFADLCVGVFCVYQNMISYFMDNWIFGNFMCKMYHFINTLSHTASILILVVICIERYLAIIHPMRCKQMLTLNRLRVTIVMVWIVSAAYSSPRFYYFNTFTMPLTDSKGKVEVMCIPNREMYNSMVNDMITMLLLFFVPLFVISLLYTKIGIVLWRSSRNKMPSASPSESSSSSCAERRDSEMITANFNSRQLNRTASFHRRINNAMMSKNWYCCNCLSGAGGNRSYLSSSSNSNQRRRCQMRSTVLNSQGNNCYLKRGECQDQENDYEGPAMEMTATPLHLSSCMAGSGGVGGAINGILIQRGDSGEENKLPRMSSVGSSNSGNNTDNSNPNSTSLCCARLGNACNLHSNKNKLKTSTKGNVSFSHPPVSPYLKRSPPIPISTAEPIVVVKFEKKSSLRKSKKGKRNRCTILMNHNNGKNGDANELAGGTGIGSGSGEQCCTHVCFVKEHHQREGRPENMDETDLNLCIDIPEKIPDDSGVSTLETPTVSLHGDLPRTQSLNSTCACCLHQNGSIPSPLPTPSNSLEIGGSGAPVSKGIRRVRVVRGSKYGTRALQSRRKIIRMLIVIVFAFAVCNLPFHARKMWQYFGNYYPGSVFSSLFTPITFLVMYANSGINPILYAFMSKKFRMSFRDLLCCKLRRSLRISRNASVRSTHVIPMSTAT